MCKSMLISQKLFNICETSICETSPLYYKTTFTIKFVSSIQRSCFHAIIEDSMERLREREMLHPPKEKEWSHDGDDQ